MSDAEATPRPRRGRPPASASKASEAKNTPNPPARSSKKVAEKPQTGRSTTGAEAAPSAAEEDVGTSTMRSTRKRGEKKTTEKEAVPVVVPESDDDVKVLRTVKPKRPAAAPVVKKEVTDTEEEEAEGDVVDSHVEEKPTSSKAASRKEKQKEMETTAKPSRRGRVVEGAESAAGEGEEQREKRTGSRSARKGKKAVEEEEDEEEAMEEIEKRSGPARSTRKGRKERVEEDEEEEEQNDQRPTRSTRKGKGGEQKEKQRSVSATRWGIRENAVVDADEYEERNERDKSRSSSGGTKGDVSGEEDDIEEEPKKRTVSRSPRKGRKGKAVEAESEEEEEPEKNKRTASRSTRRGRKAVERENEEEEEEETAKGTAIRSTRRGRKVNEEEEYEEGISPKKKTKVTRGEREEEQGSSRSRARRRIDLNAEEEPKGAKGGKGKKEKELMPLETPEKERAKTVEERKKTRAARRVLNEDDEVEQVDVKPLLPFKPEFVYDLNDQDEEEKGYVSNEDRSDDEITVESTSGVSAASDVLSKEEQEACIAVVKTIRIALSSVFESKDDRAFKNAVVSINKAKTMAYQRDDYDVPSDSFYDEIECQLINMMGKSPNETKKESEGKQRVLDVIAKALIKNFNELEDNEYGVYWHQIEYLLNKFATAEESQIRANFCFWVSSLLSFSKQIHQEENARLNEEGKTQPQRNMESVDDSSENGVDEDRRQLDGHILKLRERRRLYHALYQSLKHDDYAVRIAAIRALSSLQDDPIPPTFTEAVKHSPKDLIMRLLMDVHVNVRKTAIDELRPTTDQQIEFLIRAAMQEKHENVRNAAFCKLGRLSISQFNVAQRHAMLGMVKDNVLSETIESSVLYPWLYEMVHGENPNPIIVKGDKRGRKKANTRETKDKWCAAPLQLLRYLDCVNHSEDVLYALRKGSAMARKESGYGLGQVATWIMEVIESCEKDGLGLITKTEYKHLLERSLTDAARASIITFWLHCLQFVHENKRNQGELYDGLDQLSPSMGDLRKLIEDLLDDERERRAPRKKMRQIDVTHPAFVPTSPQLQSVVTMLLRAFAYLQHGDDDAMKEWKKLLMTLTRGDLCDLSPSMWEVIMGDLLKYHSKEEDRDDMVYEVASKMGLDFDAIVGGRTPKGKQGTKSPMNYKSPKSRRSGRGAGESSTPKTPKKEDEEEKRMEERKLVLTRPDCLGMLYGALKTGFFDTSAESLSMVFKAELDVYQSVSDNRLRAICLECIGMFGIHSPAMAERYMRFVMENLLKFDLPMDEIGQEEGVKEEKETRKKKKKINRVDQDELEKEYERREKEERERREAERRSKRGGRNHCRGLALAVISDLIICHSLPKVESWWARVNDETMYGSTEEVRIDICNLIKTLAMDEDLDLVFNAARCAFKLSIHYECLASLLIKTIALFTFRVMHPSSFGHSNFRATVLCFLPHFGGLSHANQLLLSEVVSEMLSMMKGRSPEYKDFIDKDKERAYDAVKYVAGCFAPSVLAKRHEPTAHSLLLTKLSDSLEKCEAEAKEEGRVDMEYYNALLSAVDGMEFSTLSAASLNALYNLLVNNLNALTTFDKKAEARKKTEIITKKVMNNIDCVNEIMRLSKGIGEPLKPEEVHMPYHFEAEGKIEGLKEKAMEMGKDIREFSPVQDGRPPKVGWTPLKNTAKKENEIMRGVLSSLKKEPARSKSYATTAAAKRREKEAAAAASSAQTTPIRPSNRAHLRRGVATPMTTIEESDQDD